MNSPKCGDRLEATVKATRDCGVFLLTSTGQEVYIPLCRLSRQRPSEYKPGEKLNVTITRPAMLDDRKDEALATDRDLRPLKEVKPGALVTGFVASIVSHGILLDIGVPKPAFGRWKHILPLGKEQDEYKKGDVLTGLRVRSVRGVWINVGAAALKVRKFTDFQVGDKVEGEVADMNIKLGAVFFDVDADIDASALSRSHGLLRRADQYCRGDTRLLEVVRIARVRGKPRLTVKDLGSVEGPAQLQD